jgi:murein DD-endopeptidase MepM/ murein hydrolase activator NlpD
LFQQGERGFGQAGGAAALSFGQAGALAGRRRGFDARIRDLLDRGAPFDLTPDLGSEIASRTWFRGLVTCILLCSAAIALAPEFRPIPVSVPAPVAGDALDEVRTHSIAPLAYGSDTGRRMAPTDAVQNLTDTPERPSLDLTASIGQGDSLARVLERSGVGAGEAGKVAAMFAAVADPAAIKPGTAIKLTLGRRASRTAARPLDFLAFRARIDLGVVVKREGGILVLERIPIAVDRTPVRIEGRVGDSLYRSARAAGAPAKAVEAYLRAIAAKVSLGADVNADARFDLVIEHARAATGESEYGKLLYAGLYRGSRKLQLIEWTVGGRTEWFEASGAGAAGSGFVRPVQYARVSSSFGMRLHPLLRYSRFHRGMDYAAPHGTPILAVSDGMVAFAGRSGGYGNFVRLSHSSNMGTGYAHMSRIAVSPGQRVAAGQVIGYVGSTGLSTGSHLHFEVYRGGQPINPATATFLAAPALSGEDLARFKSRLSGILASARRPGAAGSSGPASGR